MSLIHQAPVVVQGRRPGLYLGGKADAKDRDKLERYNVTHILNMTTSKEVNIKAGVPNFFESSGRFVYKRIAVLDAPTSVSDLAERSDEIVGFIAKGLHHGSVLVHCQRGVSRSTTAVLLYLMRRLGMPLSQALTLVQRRRPQAAPIPAFVTFLEEYEVGLRETGVVSSTSSGAKRPAGAAQPSGPTAKRPLVGPVFRCSRDDVVHEAEMDQRSMDPETGSSHKAEKLDGTGEEITGKMVGPIGRPASANDALKEYVPRRIGPTMPPEL
ncbi:predicted protein [Phaeodactylum tricornutum CCAP 1055/1]|uniref:protein-tyrosine-phosphatase n=2 Tax=Phaeodactylum tricornutum TaxID=2850 RepID=B7G1E7_PHATC|nr:predicted protein [Phaeodactylum tricornutum CCAP 1055/1]EEC47494.1 predicted protein [Phaeodactylum tricornutum CCAP 1055/1]|eukprot:XP_002180842.1 predicted protein [Phaeodactylum tricornutum CCAP 1055/1]